MISAENELVSKARLDTRGDWLHYRLYQQDGSMQAMDCPDTPSNRQCVSWFQAHDRYTPIRLAGRPDFAISRLTRGCGVRLMRVRRAGQGPGQRGQPSSGKSRLSSQPGLANR